MRRLALTLVAVLILADSAGAIDLRTDTSKALVPLDEIVPGGPWNLLGVAQGGPRRGERLRAIPHVNAFWFAWAAFHPTTSVHPE
jgi:hypothetical protein